MYRKAVISSLALPVATAASNVETVSPRNASSASAETVSIGLSLSISLYGVHVDYVNKWRVLN